jgi:sugar phosphate isomerase/epimerase
MASVQRAVKYGRIKQSLTYWCLNIDWNWDIDRICTTAKDLGCQSVELVPPEMWPTVRKHGLQTALASDFGAPNVITFTGFKWRDAEDPNSGEIPLAEGAANSVKALSELGKYAAGKNVTLCLEHLSTRDHTHPMKSHPGYQGDDIDYVADIVKRVDSAHVKLLFDIYHVAMMNGDVIRRIRQYHDIIGHVHTAGNPGRNELDDRQEINFPAVMRALLEVGYTGYVGQEFIPTHDPIVGLTQAVSLCDVP